jgi:hypothetical protein
MIDRQASIALLREELEQQRTRAEAAEAELRELRRVVDAWAKLYDQRDALADRVISGSNAESSLRDAMAEGGLLLAMAEAEKELRSHA